MSVKVLKSPYSARPTFQDLHDDPTRFKVIVAHRRAGKTVFCINHIIRQAMQCKKPRPQYAYLAPEKAQAKKIVWNYLKEYTSFLPGVKISESELKVEIPTIHGTMALIYVDGAESPDRLRGMYFDGVVLDEVAQMPRTIWQEVVSPSLMDRGGWAVFIGTPKGKNIFKELYDLGTSGMNHWSSNLFKASETGILSKDELEIQRTIQGDELYAQEYECDWNSTFMGSFYGKQLKQLIDSKDIGVAQHNRDYKVVTAWDLGYQDKTAIWFAQLVEDRVYIIDYYENSRQNITHYVNYILSKPYVYLHHIIPHDAYQNHMNSEFSSAEIMRRSGLPIIKAKTGRVIEGINATRHFLSICKFDKVKCQTGLNALGDYKARENPMVGVMDQEPVHDENSHAADAFRYLATTMIIDKHERVYKIRTFMTEDKKYDHYDDYDPFDF